MPAEQKKLVSKLGSSQVTTTNHQEIWDCGSSLYDSFELKSLEKQLDSAIASRTLSMPHLSDRRLPQPPLEKQKHTSKLSRSFHRLIRALFKPKNTTKLQGSYNNFVAYDRSAALSTIPEVPEFDGFSPELRSLLGRSASERFTAATSIGISCS